MDAGGIAAPTARETAPVLLPYVPRLVADWVADAPDERWRQIPATMVFADLSGFTAMSERLSRLGRVGAEEVTDAIGTCFAELLAVAYRAGGGLLKFGGDALLLAFTGDNHAVRAVSSAAAMRERLRDVGRLKTSAGNVALRMSVGVHTGIFDCFLVGSPTRELLVTGPAASAVVAMEHDASAGQIVLSHDTAAALPAQCAGDALGAGVLLRRTPGPPPVVAEDFSDAHYDVDMRGFVPEEVQEHVVAGGGAPEHRNVTVAFVHYDGLDERCQRDGGDVTALALDELVSIVERACSAHDVALLATDVDADGGKFLLAAGAPSVRGHDEARMLAAARRIVDAQPAIHVRIGVHRGAVFAGDVGPYYRRTYTVMGDTVNLAARLMAAAAPGEILASGPVVDRAAAFAARALEPLKVKGKKAPVQAYAIGATGATREPIARAVLDLPFVGRSRERAVLHAGLDDARAGHGSAVYLSGPAGIGKTRLVEELVTEAPDVRVTRIVCEAYEIATPYAAAGRLLRAVLGLLPDTPADEVLETLEVTASAHAPELRPWLPLVAEVVGVEMEPSAATSGLAPQFRAARTAATVAAFVLAVSLGTSLLVVEDDEWMDDASRDVVEVLIASLTAVPVFVIRTGTQAPTGAVSLVLEPLSGADVRDALQQATEGAPLRPHELDELTRRADGNPLFLTELWRAMQDGGLGDELPDSVEGLVTAQIDRLPVALRQVLSFAAVLGRSFDRTDLATLASDDFPVDDDLWLALGEFVELEDERRARFRHGLLRDTAYAKLPYRRRRELHLRAALTIETALPGSADSEAELLSLHFFSAQAFKEAWHYARIAAERARARYANVEAAALFERALSAARRLPALDPRAVASVREALGDVRDRNGEYERARADYRLARNLIAGDRVREAELFLKEAWIPERIGRYPDAVRLIRKGLRAVDAVPGAAAAKARAQLAAWYAAIRQGQGRQREAIEWCERAIAEARAAGDRDAEAHALFVLDWAHMERGNVDLARNSGTALELYTELGDVCGQASVLNNMGAWAYWEGRWDDALRLYERAREAYTRAGSAVDAAMATANIAEVLSDQGHLDAAERQLLDALRVARAAGYHYDVALINGFLGRNAIRSGRIDDGVEYLARARGEYQEAALPGDVLRIDVWQVEALVARRDYAAALALAVSVERELGDGTPEVALLQRLQAVAHLALGDPDRARTLLDTSLAAARARNAAHEVAQSLDVVVRNGERFGLDAEAVDELVAERDQILSALGAVAVAVVP